LSALLDRLKEVNEMNKQLTIQALQFISGAFDMIMPGEKENMNYKEPQAARKPVSRLTLFDSKA